MSEFGRAEDETALSMHMPEADFMRVVEDMDTGSPEIAYATFHECLDESVDQDFDPRSLAYKRYVLLGRVAAIDRTRGDYLPALDNYRLAKAEASKLSE
jgi:hypothetical protein